MKLSIRYFGALRERLDRASESLLIDRPVTNVGDVEQLLIARGEPYQSAFSATANLRVAVNQVMTSLEEPVEDGMEIAFFPPVTGG